jgi:hypothetical protein
MSEVKKFGDDHPDYNILACTKGGKTANCQSCAAHLYKHLTGKEPATKGCPDCPAACKK